jgi:phosphoribosylglycinamide formyltransferase 1
VAATFKIAVLASGTGTNLQALIDQVHGRDGIEIVAVGSDKPGAPALDRARRAEIPVAVFPAAEYGGDREARDIAFASWLQQAGAQLVVLAGYMQIIRPVFLERFPQRVINIHPSLLPAFPGLDAVGQALAAGVKVFGVTVHFAEEGVDTGAIIMQRAVELPAARTPDDVLPQIRTIEHELLPQAVRKIAASR